MEARAVSLRLVFFFFSSLLFLSILCFPSFICPYLSIPSCLFFSFSTAWRWHLAGKMIHHTLKGARLFGTEACTRGTQPHIYKLYADSELPIVRCTVSIHHCRGYRAQMIGTEYLVLDEGLPRLGTEYPRHESKRRYEAKVLRMMTLLVTQKSGNVPASQQGTWKKVGVVETFSLILNPTRRPFARFSFILLLLSSLGSCTRCVVLLSFVAFLVH